MSFSCQASVSLCIISALVYAPVLMIGSFFGMLCCRFIVDQQVTRNAVKIYNISLNKESWHLLTFGLAGVGRGLVRHLVRPPALGAMSGNWWVT